MGYIDNDARRGTIFEGTPKSRGTISARNHPQGRCRGPQSSPGDGADDSHLDHKQSLCDALRVCLPTRLGWRCSISLQSSAIKRPFLTAAAPLDALKWNTHLTALTLEPLCQRPCQAHKGAVVEGYVGERDTAACAGANHNPSCKRPTIGT